MNRLVIDLRVLSPAFVRGADPSRPELRAPSFKGQLRWWYRAWNPLAWQDDSPWSEGRVMGGTREGEGRCPFTLRIRPQGTPRTISWGAIRRSADRGSRDRPGGLRYLGFSLGMPKGGERPDHRAIAPDTRLQAVHLLCEEPATEVVRGLLASWWLLAHLGGIGARSRRGFGALVLEGWRWEGLERAAEAVDALPLGWEAQSASDWSERIVAGLDVLRRWRPSPKAHPGRKGWPEHAPNLGPGSLVVARAEGWRAASDAHEEAGRTLSAGRRDHRGPPGPIDDRVTFGLPLETGKFNKRSWRPGSFHREPMYDRAGSKEARHASPLHIAIGAWPGGVGQVWTLMAGPRPGIPPYQVRDARQKKTLREPARDAVGAFVSSLPGRRWEGRG